MTAEPLAPAVATSAGVPVPTWMRLQAGPSGPGYSLLHCGGCGAEAFGGFALMVQISGELDAIHLVLCDDCAGGLLRAAAAAEGATTVQVVFMPGDDPDTAEVTVLPEPASAADEVRLLDLARECLATYAAGYHGAMDGEQAAEAS